MGERKRFSLFFEKHIGIGLRWSRWDYELVISVSIMCLTINIGIGKEK